MTVDQLIDRHIDDRSPSWEPGAGAETRSLVAQHITHRPSPRHTSRRTQLGRALDLIVRNPAAKIDRPRGTKPDINPPAPSEVIRMIAAASEPLAVFLRLGALTGARRGQLCGLRWSDIDLEAATIRWTRSLRKLPGGTADKDTKTKARWSVSLDPTTVEQLRAHRRRALESALAAGAQLPADAYVFARDPVGKLPWHPDGASQRFAALRTKLKLDGVRLHDLRHWMATEGLGGGADIETVAGRGGWANATTPLEVYSHFRPARDASLARDLARRLDGDLT